MEKKKQNKNDYRVSIEMRTGICINTSKENEVRVTYSEYPFIQY